MLKTFSPAGLQCLRTLLAGGILLVGVGLFRRSLSQALSKSFWPLLGAGVLLGTQLLLFSVALNLTYASEGALLISTATIWTALIVTAVGLETLSRRNWLGVVLALCGIALVVLGTGPATSDQAPARILGDIIMLLSAVAYGLYMVISRPLMQQYGALTVTAVAIAFSNLLMVPLGLREAIAAPWADLALLQWSLLAYYILLATVYGFVTWYRSIKIHGSAPIAIYQYLVPIAALGAAVLFLHEHPTRWQLAGIAITLYGVYLGHHRPGESIST